MNRDATITRAISDAREAATIAESYQQKALSAMRVARSARWHALTAAEKGDMTRARQAAFAVAEHVANAHEAANRAEAATRDSRDARDSTLRWADDPEVAEDLRLILDAVDDALDALEHARTSAHRAHYALAAVHHILEAEA